MVDQQLAEEIEFDLRRFEQQQKQAVSHNQTVSNKFITIRNILVILI